MLEPDRLSSDLKPEWSEFSIYRECLLLLSGREATICTKPANNNSTSLKIVGTDI